MKREANADRESSGVKAGIYDAPSLPSSSENESEKALIKELEEAEAELNDAQRCFDFLGNVCAAQQQRFIAEQDKAAEEDREMSLTQTMFDVKILNYKMHTSARLVRAENAYYEIEQRAVEKDRAAAEEDVQLEETDPVGPGPMNYLSLEQSMHILDWTKDVPAELSGSPSSAKEDDCAWQFWPVKFDEYLDTYTRDRSLRWRIDRLRSEMDEARKKFAELPTVKDEAEQLTPAIDGDLGRNEAVSGSKEMSQTNARKKALEMLMEPVKSMMEDIIATIPEVVSWDEELKQSCTKAGPV